MTTYTEYSEIATATTEDITPTFVGDVPPIKVLWYQPPVVFAARVNMPSGIAYPIQDITYDGVTTGVYTDCQFDMFFTLGSAAGLDDYGRGRLRAAPTATVLKLGRASQGFNDGELNVVDNAYITVYKDWRVMSKIPVIGADYNEYKDADIPVGDLTAEPPPIANCGPSYARSIDADTGKVIVFHDGRESFPVADGATLTTFAWDFDGGTPLFGADESDTHLYVEYDAGMYWPALTVTDSNGKSHSSRTRVLADDPDASLCVPGMQVVDIARSQQGQTVRLRTLVDLPRAEYPDGALVICWFDIDAAPESREHILFEGWHQTDDVTVRAQERYLERNSVFLCVDVAGRLDSLPGFAQRIEIPGEDEEAGLTWGEMPNPTMDKFLCYLMHWHSTAASLCDFTPSGTWDEYPFVLFDSAGASLYEQLNRQANRICPDHVLTCNRLNQLRVLPDPMLQNPDDRTATVQGNFLEEWWHEFSFTYQRPPRVYWLRGSALLTQTEWVIDDDDEKTLLTAFAIAPGTSPGQGVSEATQGEQLAKSQEDLNDVTGHRYARMNARYGQFTITPASGNDQNIEPADMTWVNVTASALTAPHRGDNFNPVRCLPKEVNISFQYHEWGTRRTTRVTLEPETVGLPALIEPVDIPLPVGEQPVPPPEPPPTVPPDDGLVGGQELVAGIGETDLYRTFDFQTDSGSGGPTWEQIDLTGSDIIMTWVVDPFSPGYIAGVGAINGWVATATAIYRVTDLFGTVGSSAVVTFPTVALWRTVQASFGRYQAVAADNPWLICVSYYGDEAGHTGTWATYSTDGGVTWAAEVLVSAFYDSGGASNPIGLYCSPKTPGLAYAAAHIETANPALSGGYVTTDWGATWTLLAVEEDEDAPLPAWGYFSDESGSFSYLGRGTSRTISSYSSSSGGPPDSDSPILIVAPPPDTKRMVVVCSHVTEHTNIPVGGSSQGSGISLSKPTTVTRVGDSNHVQPAYNTGPIGNAFESEYTFAGFAGGDWPEVNSDSIVSSPPATPLGVRYNPHTGADSGSTNTRTTSLRITVMVTEIELDDGTIYTPVEVGAIAPVHGQAGQIHSPWLSDENLLYYGALTRSGSPAYALKRAIGELATEIGPTGFGINHGHFAARAYDGDAAAMVLGGMSASQSGVWVSNDGGDTWTEIVTPSAVTPYHAAFGDDADMLFIWGPAGYVGYSIDQGAAIDNRAGNLGVLGATKLIGIAGGPTGE